MSDEAKGFRFGVLESEIDSSVESISLVDHVAAQLATITRPTQKLDALDALSLVEFGSVYVNSERTLNPSRTLKPHDQVRIHSSPRRFQRPSLLKERITQEDADYVSVFKPAGLPCGPTVDNLQENLISFLADERHQFLHLIHSIDTESEGLVVFAKSIPAQEAAKKKFIENTVTRHLVAFVERPIEARDYTSAIRVLSCESRLAETSILTEGPLSLEVSGDPIPSYSRLEIELKNGRPSDVRDLLSALDSPILGDRTHGSARTVINPGSGKPMPALLTIRFSF